MNPKNITCQINKLQSKYYARKGRAVYYIEPIDGIIFQSKLPSVADMELFNQQEYKGGIYREYSEMELQKKKTARRRLTYIRNYGKVNGRLLDIGCSVGFGLEVAQDLGFDVQGIELSLEAIAIAKLTVSDKINKADANEHICKYFECFGVVTAYDIIEHTQNPKAFLSDLYNALEQGGVIAITSPDTDHFLRYFMGSNWSMLQPMQHTFLFSKRSIKKMLKDAGFENINVYPTKKTLTFNYLFGQLSQTNPVISKLYYYARKFIPTSIGDTSVDVNIGEFFAIAKKPIKTIIP